MHPVVDKFNEKKRNEPSGESLRSKIDNAVIVIEKVEHLHDDAQKEDPRGKGEETEK